MIFKRTTLILGAWLVLFSLTFLGGKPAWAAVEDIENRFIYADYSKKISMDFKDAALIDILKIFSKQSGMNFISTGEISDKKITLFLDNISIEEALDKILDANGLTYEMAANSDVFVVKSKPKGQLITKVFPLKYATVPTASINNTGKTSKGGILEALKGILSSGGKVLEDARTNSFIITDEVQQFPLIEETIAKLDTPVLQVLIQVEMLDVSKSASDKIGIKYGQTPLVVTGASRNSYLPWDQNYLIRKGYADLPQFEAGSIDASGMSATLDFLRSQTDTRSLARPRILTLNNQTAIIEIATDEAIGTSASSTTVGTTGSSSSTGAERAKTGVSLEVTPQANAATGEIILGVKPTVTEAKTGSILDANGRAFKDPEERSSQSILKINSGETVIIGGLLRVEEQNEVSKLPFLGDIPIVGAGFRHKDKTSRERELIIFITPHILDDKIKQTLDKEISMHLSREVNDPQKKKDIVSQQLDSTETDN
jgi:protein transport protein HofQ